MHFNRTRSANSIMQFAWAGRGFNLLQISMIGNVFTFIKLEAAMHTLYLGMIPCGTSYKSVATIGLRVLQMAKRLS